MLSTRTVAVDIGSVALMPGLHILKAGGNRISTGLPSSDSSGSHVAFVKLDNNQLSGAASNFFCTSRNAGTLWSVSRSSCSCSAGEALSMADDVDHTLELDLTGESR